MTESMDRVSFKINGVKYSVGGEVSSNLTLLNYIRENLELRGTKYMCQEAGCGACVVVAQKPSALPYAVNSCMLQIVACHELEITTIEQLGNKKTGYHPLQQTLADYNGTQCGYCSPGWVMSMYSLLRNKPDITMLEVEQSLGSNICRCTGYRPILDAFKEFAKDSPKRQILDIEDLKICEKSGKACDKSNCEESEWCIVETDDVMGNDVIEIRLNDGKYWYRVVDVQSIFKILNEKGYDSYMLVGGNTAKGAYPILDYPKVLIDINGVKELKGYKIDQNLVIGAAVALTELLDIFKNVGKQEYFEYLTKLYDHLQKVAHIPVRNLGTIAGNLMIKHKFNFFSSDIYLLLETVGANLTIENKNSKKLVTMQEFLKTNMKGMVILNVMLPPLSKEYKIFTYKLMPRSTNASSIVSAGFLYQITKYNKVSRARIVYGGLSPTFNRALKTEQYLVGKELFTNETVQATLKILDSELVVVENPPEPSVAFRRKVALHIFYKGLLTLSPENIVNPRILSGAISLHDSRPVSQAQQKYDTDPSVYPLNKPIPKIEALIQCSGEAFYSDDLPTQPYEVFASFALTTVGAGEIVSINPQKALSQQGVIAFYTAKDIPGVNSFTLQTNTNVPSGEEILCDGTVRHYNQPYGIIVAETQPIAERAAKMVEVEYKNVKRPVIDIKEAVKDESRVNFYDSEEAVDRGDDIEKVVKGGNTMYGQYHFPLETIVCVIHPSEEGFIVYASSQWIGGVQVMMSKALNMQQNRIDVQVRRVGGAFGLKISRSIQSAVACGLVVQKLNRPCRFIQSLTSSMRSVGKKLPSTTNFEVGVNSRGVIQYMNYHLYQDIGYIENETFSFLVMEGFDNCYDKSRWNFKCYNVITDTPKNSWLRAPGTFDSVAQAEFIMEQIAYELSLDPVEVRLNNLKPEFTSSLVEMYNTLKKDGQYEDRRAFVNQFNKQNRWKKRGLRFSFLNFNVFPYARYNVILSVYFGDGTVVINHGGIEMGQGINTKCAQICAYYLNIPVENIQVKSTNTIISPNCVESGASLTSQNIGLGVFRCCMKLLKRLEPIKAEKPNASWIEVIQTANDSKIDLQVQDFITEDDPARYDYNVFGIALTEVEIDVLTGEYELLRVDILEDVGRSVSPELDVGQVEGAFIMGLGYWTSEKLFYDVNTGELLTNRTWNYKVPMCTDIPQDLRVYFRNNSFTFEPIQGAKIVGEPPLCLSVGIPLAIREAISQARLESNIPPTDWFPIDGPSSVETVGLLSATDLKDLVLN